MQRRAPAGLCGARAGLGRDADGAEYRNPAQVADGGVLVVGASSSGTQIAHELQRAGRAVTLAVGEHIRAPRVYRGRDLEWWMDAAGVLDERYDQVDDIARARRVPSLQLAGTPDRSTLDLNALTDIGVRLTGRLAGILDGKAQFAGSLRNMCAMSDLKMGRLLDLIDEWAQRERPRRHGGAAAAPAADPRRGRAAARPRSRQGRHQDHHLGDRLPAGYSWLQLPVFDRKGMVRHDGGVVCAPGVYLMGMQFLRRRKSALIDGAGDDARELSAHLAGYLDGAARPGA